MIAAEMYTGFHRKNKFIYENQLKNLNCTVKT